MNERKNFFRFVIPSILAFALSGVYTIVDGFFIGQSLGDIGLAAIVLGYPITAIIQAIGTGIGLLLWSGDAAGEGCSYSRYCCYCCCGDGAEEEEGRDVGGGCCWD